MAEWTPEAQTYFEGYLQQVAALARHSGDDAVDIVENLREHIRHEVEAGAGTFVTLEMLRQVIAVVGAPEQVVEMDIPKPPPQPSQESLTEAQAAAKAGLALEVPPTVVYTPPPPAPQRGISTGCGLALIALPFIVIILIAVLGVLSAILLPALSRSREAARRISCQNNLKQVGIVLKMYADEHDGRFLALSEEAGRLMFSTEDMEDILHDHGVLSCPSSRNTIITDSWAEGIDDHSYYYLSHPLINDEMGLAYVEAYRNIAQAGDTFDQEFTLQDGTKLTRITRSSARAMNMTADQIPVMIERFDNHLPNGGNVLYQDGHVEFVKLNSKFPMTEMFLEALASIDQ